MARGEDNFMFSLNKQVHLLNNIWEHDVNVSKH